MARVRPRPGSFRLLVSALAITIDGIGLLHAQTVAPPKKGDANIVINPTMTECHVGWRDGEKKWTKEQFDKFCAIMQSPAPVLVNPTLAECDKGWDGTLRWTRDQFDVFCAHIRKSK